MNFIGIFYSPMTIAACFPTDPKTLLADAFTSKADQPPSSLKRLTLYLKRHSETVNHTITKIGKRNVLNIGYLHKNEKEFMLLVSRAVQDGSISEINAGQITGPKVLGMLNHIYKSAPNQNLKMTGFLSPKKLMMEASIDLQNRNMAFHTFGKEWYEANDENPWTNGEVRNFQNAIQELGLHDLPKNPTGMYSFSIVKKNGKSTIQFLPYIPH